jgi:hypothetical protein
MKPWRLVALVCVAQEPHGVRRATSRLLKTRDTRPEIYNWFTAGSDTADLKEAKALLDELNG